MNTFYIVRHGKTENNRAGRLSGWIDTPLIEDGLLPTEWVARKLDGVSIDFIYSSDLGRAFVTAYELAWLLDFKDKITRLPGLREVSYGIAGNMLTADAYKQFPQLDRDTHFTPPDGESLGHMQRRVFQTVNELNKKHTNATIVLVCHSGVMAALNAGHLGEDFGGHNITVEYPHEFVGRFTFEDGTVTAFEEFAGKQPLMSA